MKILDIFDDFASNSTMVDIDGIALKIMKKSHQMVVIKIINQEINYTAIYLGN